LVSAPGQFRFHRQELANKTALKRTGLKG